MNRAGALLRLPFQANALLCSVSADLQLQIEGAGRVAATRAGRGGWVYLAALCLLHQRWQLRSWELRQPAYSHRAQPPHPSHPAMEGIVAEGWTRRLLQLVEAVVILACFDLDVPWARASR